MIPSLICHAVLCCVNNIITQYDADYCTSAVMQVTENRPEMIYLTMAMIAYSHTEQYLDKTISAATHWCVDLHLNNPLLELSFYGSTLLH